MKGNAASGTVDEGPPVGVAGGLKSDSVVVAAAVVLAAVVDGGDVVDDVAAVVVPVSVGVEMTPVQTAPEGQHAMLFASSVAQTVSDSQQTPAASRPSQELYPLGQALVLVLARLARGA